MAPGTERLLRILHILEGAERAYTSAELEALTGWPGHTIRKDISSLGALLEAGGRPAGGRPPGAGTSGGYDPRRLVPRIKEALGLDNRRSFCVVGLGRLGSAYLNLDPASLGEFELAAGFDANVNRVEILKSPVPLYPAHKMGEVISRLGIEIALLCVPAEAAQGTVEKLAAAGIQGIVNFAPAVITAPPGVEVRNVYVRDELRALSVKIFEARRIKMKRVYNFSPGPSMLPLPVLERAAAELPDANGTGQSVMEMSHRSGEFKPIIEKTEALLRELMEIPSNYRVLFLQGGASLQFAMVPLNLAGTETADGADAGCCGTKRPITLIDTGIWAKKAADEAAKYAEVNIAASSGDKAYTYIPAAPAPRKDDAYYHITWNNTIVGTKWPAIPDTGDIPLVTDLSSAILSEPLDVSRFGLIYAGAQKNLGPAGTTVVIIRDDLLSRPVPAWVPAMLRYDVHNKEKSLYNTPPCYGIYVIGLVLEWLKGLGGVDAIGEINRKKAGLLYDYLEASKTFYSPVEKNSRSLMNIPFVPRESDPDRKAAIEKRFVAEAAAAGLVNLAGHRLVGGMRASIYNGMPVEGVNALIAFMEKFEKEAR